MYIQTDSELVLAIQNGDLTAFELLVKRYQFGLHIFVNRIVHDSDAATDVVQDSFISLYKAIDSVDTKKKFSTFLFEIAKNKSISYLRTRKRFVSLDSIAELIDDESFIEKYLRKEVMLSVRRAVSSLPEKYKKVIRLYFFEELSYEEISSTLHLPINTVRTHLKRAKEQLKSLLPYEAI